MGFDITAQNIEKEEVAYHRAYMGAFRMMTEQGYDWFGLINADDCYGGVSGNGEEKPIDVEKLRNAFEKLRSFKVTKLSSEGRDEITDRKVGLLEFMEICIKWCEDNGEDSIIIYFG